MMMHSSFEQDLSSSPSSSCDSDKENKKDKKKKEKKEKKKVNYSKNANIIRLSSVSLK